MKKSKNKATVPGRKLAFRSYEYALAEAEHVISGSEEKLAGFTPEPTWKNLLVDFVDHGHIDAQWQGHDAIMAAHDYRSVTIPPLAPPRLPRQGVVRTAHHRAEPREGRASDSYGDSGSLTRTFVSIGIRRSIAAPLTYGQPTGLSA